MAYILFFYGLAFFSMGLAIILEISHCMDIRLRYALRLLAIFGLIHGIHEWVEMFGYMGHLPMQGTGLFIMDSLRIGLLSFSFVMLSAFGASLLSSNENMRRVSLLLPLTLTAIWAFGLLWARGVYSSKDYWDVVDVWTRYVIGVPAALVACAGLVYQQREFRRQGMAKFGRDSLWAAIAFFWYGAIGQTFVRQSAFPPSQIINQTIFLNTFGFPVQLLRAAAAVVAAIFVIRFLRSFEVETDRQLEALRADQLEESKRRENLRGEMLRRIVDAQESERQRIARELHDETGQSLTAIGLGLRGATSTLYIDADKAAQNLRQLEGLTLNSLVELQRIIADLRPSHLDDLGLPAALRWYAGEIQKRVKLQVSVDVTGEPVQLSSELKPSLFRVAQEALTNVVKHANARNTSVRVVFNYDTVTVQVEDDGQGFTTSRVGGKERPSWGLLGMQERASLLGGSFAITSSPGKGTRVEVTIPYNYRSEGTIDENAVDVS